MLQRRLLAQQTRQAVHLTHSAGVTRSHKRLQGSHMSRHQETLLLLSTLPTFNPWLHHCPRLLSIKLCAAAEEAVVSSSANNAPTTSQQVQLPPCHSHDIIRAVAVDGSELFLEILPAHDSIPTAQASADVQPPQQLQKQPPLLAHKGVIYMVDQTGSSDLLRLNPKGWQLHQEHPLIKALPGWSQALQLQQSKQQLPQQPLVLQSAAVVYSVAQLQAAVQQNPAVWCDGTGPLDPPLQALQQQTLCAGEIECLLNRRRGVVMVQLSVGWDAAAPQPVNNPLVLHALTRALADKHISVFLSKAPGDLGLTAILSAKAEPFMSWARHLASFGAQAAVVADSPYYKLLIGRMLGYKEENIRYHIQSTSGRQHPSAEVVAAVAKDMAKLGKKKPELPWKPDAAAGGRGRQQQQQQQQKRAARARR